jgi:hypothetical protein
LLGGLVLLLAIQIDMQFERKLKSLSMRKKSSHNCRPSFRISEADHLLPTTGRSRAGSTLSRDGKKEKKKRQKKGCLYGVMETFQLTVKQKKNLPKSLQKAILAHHRKKGKKIID